MQNHPDSLAIRIPSVRPASTAFRARVVVASSVLAILGSCTSAPETTPAAAPEAGAAAERIRADVAWLADDAREGRRAGTDAALDCAHYIEKRFQALGLEPAGERGYFQGFVVPLDPRDGGGSSLTVADDSTRQWRKPDVAPLFCSDAGEITAPVVFAGHGIVHDERQWNDYEGKDVKGAIAFIVRGTPAESAASATTSAADTALVTKDPSFGASGSIFNKVMTAKRLGAVGVILAPAPGESDASFLAFDAGQAARAGIPALMVRASVAEALFPDYAEHVSTPAAKLEPSARSLVVRADVVRASGAAYNVLGRVRGKRSTRTVVVGAHYDHLGHGGAGSLSPNEIGSIHNGADDNASGTAVVLEMARMLAASPPADGDVVLALWSGEELGLLGSEWWGEHPTVPLASVVANLNLDMVGRAGNGKLQVLGAGTSPPFASWMSDAGAHAGLELTVSTTGGALGGSSDHQSFLKRSIPALHLFSGLHADYHKPSDDTERFEANGASKVAVLGTDLARRMLAEPTLAFVQPKVEPNERGEIKSGFRAWFGSIPNYAYEGKGVLIDGTSGGSPAERAGFLKGDILLHVGEVTIDNIYDFTYALQLYKPGDVVLVRYQRDNQPEEVRVTLSTRAVE